MQTVRNIVAASALALGLAATQQANAVVVDSINDSFTILFTDTNINATAKFTVTNWDAVGSTSATFNVEVTNNSVASPGYRLTSLGIQNLNPDQDDQSTNNGWNSTSGGSLDLCIYDSTLCEWGSDGVLAGSNESFTLFLDFGQNNPLTSAGLSFSGFYGRFYETQGSDSEKWVGGCVVGEQGCGGSTSVPEPATLGLFGLGLLGVAFGMRRKQA